MLTKARTLAGAPTLAARRTAAVPRPALVGARRRLAPVAALRTAAPSQAASSAEEPGYERVDLPTLTRDHLPKGVKLPDAARRALWLLLGDYSDQRSLTQQVIATALREALAGAGVAGVKERASAEVKDVMGVATLEDVQEFKAAAEAGKPQDAPWVLPTALLLGYAAIHASSLGSCLTTFASHGGGPSVASLVGLGVVGTIAAGLIYENTILAAGRFISDRGTKNLNLLDALNDPRFLFHSAAPLLSIAGLDMAQRAGVEWASSPLLAGGVTAAVLAVVGLSTLRNTLLLETKPTWSSGIFHFTFDDSGFDFTRIIPVAATTVLLTALGGAAAAHDAAFLPFALGPAACLALSAGVIPRSVAPMILTGNGGEAALIASLAYTEALLAAMGR